MRSDGKITRDDLNSYNEIVKKEKEMLEKVLSSNGDIYKVFYNNNIMVIQFKHSKPVTSEYLESLNDLIDYDWYSIEAVTITEEFFKIKYKEQVLQLNIFL